MIDVDKNIYYNPAYRLQKLLRDGTQNIPLNTLIDILGFDSEKEFVDFYVECSLTGIDIDWNSRQVVFTNIIKKELEDLIEDIELQGLFK